MKQIALSVMFLMLAACGGKSADDYVGTWQRDENELLQFIEIKKDNGNYVMIRSNRTDVLSEQDGELVLNYGMGNIPLKLSDDRKTLLANLYAGGSNRFIKIEDETCKKLITEYQTAQDKLVEHITNKELLEAVKSIDGKYRSQCGKK